MIEAWGWNVERHAEIAGVGLVGLTAALGLARAGWTVCAHEASESLRATGGGLYLFEDVLAVLDHLGAAATLRPHLFRPRAFVNFVNGLETSREINEAPFHTVLRGRLFDALHGAAKGSGVDLRVKSAVSAVDADGALVANGEKRPSDLAVVANGIGSELLPGMGVIKSRWQFPDKILRLLLRRSEFDWSERDSCVDLWLDGDRPLRALYTPCGPDHCYLVLMAPVEDDEALLLESTTTVWSRYFPVLAPLLQQQAIEHRVDQYGMTSLEAWSRGKTVAVGDAAHAMPSSIGRGANMGMMNAAAMVTAVNAGAVVTEALAAWERKQRPALEQLQREAKALAAARTLSRSHAWYRRETPTEITPSKNQSRIAGLEPGASYRRLIKDVEEQHVGVADMFGRPWSEHFQRVTLRVWFRNPHASPALIEAAMLHDALMDRGGGYEYLEQLGLSQESIRIIELVTPPPNADYYRDFAKLTDADAPPYIDYIRRICDSGNRDAVELKLADINDTIDQIEQFGQPGPMAQLVRYLPSREMLVASLLSGKRAPTCSAP
jgi:2-methyl-3-hydroxypyridine 5-carboxylic acid dioxygenase